jgi:small Trp-rich protein
MPLAVICVIILLLKLGDIGPVGSWSWWWVMLPFAVLFFWWEIGSKWVGWDKKAAEKRMKEDEKMAAETKRKNRGF